MTKLLLTSVFKPFSVDDAYGVKENVCELMHNQVTRGQKIFSIRSHNRSFALNFLAENLKVPATVLDFPTLEEFVNEISGGEYSHLGISFIVPNFEKARKMCIEARRASPHTKIIVGGHGAAIPNVKGLLDCDVVCLGEGIKFLREHFGEDIDSPVFHPAIPLDCYRKLMGVEIPNSKALLVPGVGCLNRCNFCCTSHFFDGYTPLFQTAEELFSIMIRVSDTLGLKEFFVLDENFLSDKNRALELAALMRKHNRLFVLDIFSSLDTLPHYDVKTLLELGIQFIWVGIETRTGLYRKTCGIDARSLFRKLKNHGISILASSILFFDHHNAKSIYEDIDYTISLEPDFIQFMELSPLPGTSLYQKLKKDNRILPDIPLKEWHGQGKIWFKHPEFSLNQSKEILDSAFQREFEVLGPSLLRIAETRMLGVRNFPKENDSFMESRRQDAIFFARQMRPLLWAIRSMAKFVGKKTEKVIREYDKMFGPQSFSELLSSIAVDLIGRIETRRLKRNVHQPATYREQFRQ